MVKMLILSAQHACSLFDFVTSFNLTLSMMGKYFRKLQFEIFFVLFLPENRL